MPRWIVGLLFMVALAFILFGGANAAKELDPATHAARMEDVRHSAAMNSVREQEARESAERNGQFMSIVLSVASVAVGLFILAVTVGAVGVTWAGVRIAHAKATEAQIRARLVYADAMGALPVDAPGLFSGRHDQLLGMTNAGSLTVRNTTAANPVHQLPPDLRTFNYAPRLATRHGSTATPARLPSPDAPLVTLPARVTLPELGKPPSPYAVPFGLSSTGPLWFDLPTEIHGLLGGSTGGGKTTAVRAMLETLLNRHTSASLQVYLIDPKQTGFTPYKGHGCVAGLATDAVRWVELLEALEFERARRQAWLVANDLDQWRPETGLPYIAVFIDELRNLTADETTRDILVKFLAESRSAGVSVIAATQYPSARYVPRDMTVNMPARACFHVPTYVESNVILSQSGAEKLPSIPGRAMVMLDGPPVEVQMPFVERSDKWAWGGKPYASTEALPLPPRPDTHTQALPPAVTVELSEDEAAIIERLKQGQTEHEVVVGMYHVSSGREYQKQKAKVSALLARVLKTVEAVNG